MNKHVWTAILAIVLAAIAGVLAFNKKEGWEWFLIFLLIVVTIKKSDKDV